jgi:hypothetical protein
MTDGARLEESTLQAGRLAEKLTWFHRWEGNNEVRSLNPGCCNSANYYYMYPFMLVGFWTWSASSALPLPWVAISTSPIPTSTSPPPTEPRVIIDFIGLGRHRRHASSLSASTSSPEMPTSLILLQTPTSPPTMIPTTTESKVSILCLMPSRSVPIPPTPFAVNDGCIAFNNSGSAYPTFSTTAACSDKVNCVLRLAMLFKDSSPSSFPTNGGASQGSTTNREQFFPGCTSNANDYLFYYGTEDQLKVTLLDNLRICPKSIWRRPCQLLHVR